MNQTICDRCKEVISIVENKYWVEIRFAKGGDYILHFCKTCGKIKKKEIIDLLDLEGHKVIYV